MQIEFSITLVLCVSIVIVSIMGMNDMNFKYKMMMSPEKVKHHGEWYRIFSHGWVHGDYMHLFFNVFVLWQFGPGAEHALTVQYGTAGPWVFLLLYLGGLCAATVPSIKKHSENSAYWSLGASGAVSAVLFATIIVYPLVPLNLLLIPLDIPGWIFGILYLAFEYYSNHQGRTNIAHDAHIFGGLFGIIFIFAVIPGSAQNLVQQIIG